MIQTTTRTKKSRGLSTRFVSLLAARPDAQPDALTRWDHTERRATLTMVNPATGVRGPAKNMAEFQEWQRRRANGLDEIQVQEDDPVDYGGGGDGVSEMGDDD